MTYAQQRKAEILRQRAQGKGLREIGVRHSMSAQRVSVIVRGAAHLPSFAKPPKVDVAYVEQLERGLVQGIARVKAFAEIGKSADAKGTLKALAAWLHDSLIP